MLFDNGNTVKITGMEQTILNDIDDSWSGFNESILYESPGKLKDVSSYITFLI